MQNPYRASPSFLEPPATGSHTWSAEPLYKSEPSPADHVCHPITYEGKRSSVQDPKPVHHHPCLHRRHQTPTRRRELPGPISANQPTDGDLAAPHGCLASCAKNERAARCPTYSKRAIIRPAVAGHNLMQTIIRDHLRPLAELIRKSNPGKHCIGRRGCATGQPLQASLNRQRQPSALCPMAQPLVSFDNRPSTRSFEIRSVTWQHLGR